MRRIHITRNNSKVWWKKGKIPIRQTLIWFGPLFIRIAPKPIKEEEVENEYTDVCNGCGGSLIWWTEDVWVCDVCDEGREEAGW